MAVVVHPALPTSRAFAAGQDRRVLIYPVRISGADIGSVRAEMGRRPTVRPGYRVIGCNRDVASLIIINATRSAMAAGEFIRSYSVEILK